MLSRPHHVNPRKETTRVIHIYKNFAAVKGISHIGLGVAASNTSTVLNNQGFWNTVVPVLNSLDIKTTISNIQNNANQTGQIPISHVVIAAPWVETIDMLTLLKTFPDINFVLVCHSNVGFLQADSNGVKIFREALSTQVGNSQFQVAGNCKRFCDWVKQAYSSDCLWLPNLYNFNQFQTIKLPHKNIPWKSGKIRIGSFGAMRPLKNQISAAGAALEISNRLGADLEFWLSSGRAEGGGIGVKRAIQELFANIPNAQIKESGWQSWSDFRRIVGNMDLLLQPSYTESFNMVTADGIAEGVASVVSDAIDWVPSDWIASVDDVHDIANKGIALLHDPHTVQYGQEALHNYVQNGIPRWTNWFLS